MTQTKEALRKLRQKYHLGEYKNTNRAHSIKSKKGVKKMAKRRKARSSKRSKNFGSANLWGNVAGTLGFVAYEAILAPKLPISGNMRAIAEIGIGLYLSKKGGIIGNVGKAAVAINTYKLVATYVAPMLGTMTQ